MESSKPGIREIALNVEEKLSYGLVWERRE
jgi:hypothetical protein